MKKLNLRKKQGITLIALVVTIVVLLILAAISIGVLTGENGIIKQSQQAKEDTEIAEEKEVLNLSATQAIGEDVYGNLEEEPFREKLNENAEGCELEKIGDKYLVTFPSEREYVVNGNGDINLLDKENTIELVAKLFYNSKYETYTIGVGFKDYQVVSDIFHGKSEEEKEEFFLQIINTTSGNNFANMEEVYKFVNESGEINTPVNSLDGLAEILGFDSAESMLLMFPTSMWLEEIGISGTLIAPNGDLFWLSTDNIQLDESMRIFVGLFESYCYQYDLYENGEYTFRFIGDDGSYGETTLKIDNETPQIVACGDSNELVFDSDEIGLIIRLDNFVKMEDASMKVLDKENEIINLTSYISQEKIIILYDTPLRDNYFAGEFTCMYQGKILTRKDNFDVRLR